VLSVRPPDAVEPLLHVKLRNWVVAQSEEAGLRHIVCPVDFSQCSDVAAAHALALAERFHAKLHFVHSLQVPYWPMQQDTSSYLIELSKHADRAMKKLVAESRARYADVEAHMVEGGAADQTLVMAGQLGADLIVMGTHGRTGFVRLTVGSVAERVVRSSHVPVWIVRDRSA
jgi:nucleotide-binding universal stress UspA family protein